MRKLTYLVASTLDGFVAGPDGSDPSGPDGFWPITPDYVEYLVRHYPETLPAAAREAMGIDASTTFDTVLEGRRSYEIGLAAGVTNAYPHLRHVVFSRSLTESPDPGVELVASDPAAYVRELKAEPGEGIWLVGGGELAASLSSEIDRLVLKVAPLTIGSGVPLFGRNGGHLVQSWTVERSDQLPGGTLVLTYDRA